MRPRTAGAGAVALGVLAVAFWWDAYLSTAGLVGLLSGVVAKGGLRWDAPPDELGAAILSLWATLTGGTLLTLVIGRADLIVAYLLAGALGALAWAIGERLDDRMHRARPQAHSPQ